MIHSIHTALLNLALSHGPTVIIILIRILS